MTKISHRITGATIFEADVPTVREAAEAAVKQGVSLAGANLAGADLARADLAGADLARADLAGADLARANLAGADLAGADLAGADLAGADLARAYLAGANLAGANLADANLADAYLAGANLADANLADANLAGAYGVAGQTDPPEPYVRDTSRNYAARAERARKRHPEVPVVENLDAKILQAIEGGGSLEMGAWHTCTTTHCRAGWAIVIAGENGRELEAQHGPHRAGMLIYSCSTGRVPHFYASNEAAMKDIRECAAESTQSAAP